MARLGAIAQNLAAAVAFGTSLAAGGLSTALAIGLPEGVPPDADAVVVLTGPGVAEGLAACDALLAGGARQIVQVVGADLDAAAAGPLADALLRRLQVSFAPVSPAFPSRGSSLYLGHLFLGTVPAPGEPNLVRRLTTATDEPVGLLSFRTVAEGAGAIRAEMSRMAEWGRRFAIVDAVTDEHLRALAEAAAAQALLVGGAGLAAGLATMLAPVARPAVQPPEQGACVVLAASSARETLSQIGLARLYAPVLDLAATEDAAAAAAPLLSQARPVVIVAPPGSAATLGAVAQALVAAGVQRLMVAGETACEAVVATLAPRMLHMGAEADAGLAWCRVEDGPLHLMLKPGQSGGRDIMLRAFGAG